MKWEEYYKEMYPYLKRKHRIEAARNLGGVIGRYKNASTPGYMNKFMKEWIELLTKSVLEFGIRPTGVAMKTSDMPAQIAMVMMRMDGACVDSMADINYILLNKLSAIYHFEETLSEILADYKKKFGYETIDLIEEIENGN